MITTAKLYDPPRVGGDILAYCTKCRIELAHVIVSMVDGKPSKVQCKTCRGTHRYKILGGVSVPSGPRQRKTAPKTVIRASELWEQKMATKAKDDIVAYKANQSFKKGDVLQHPTFGLGVVEEVRSPTKVAIFFRDGEKLLAHGLK
ncbi:hypothetical protein K2X33_00355 [bacterium]|nr:hypothetical protein [bacterium]